MRLRPVALPPILLAVVLMAPGGCGKANSNNSDDFEGTQKDVAEAVYDFRDAVAKRDEAKVCDSYFTSDLRDEIVRVAKDAGRGSTCAKAIEDSLQDIDATDIEIPKDGITVTGNTATVKIKTNLTGDDPDPTDTLSLENERGWRISKLP
jgi:ketosteroid isomerase-like protein